MRRKRGLEMNKVFLDRFFLFQQLSTDRLALDLLQPFAFLNYTPANNICLILCMGPSDISQIKALSRPSDMKIPAT